MLDYGTATIGHNAPPAFDAFTLHIEDLLIEANNFLDGSGVNSADEADAVAKLLDDLRKARKDADAERAAEKRPHDDAAKAVQAKWLPLLARADLATTVCKKALTPYLERIDAEKRAAAEAARKEAERLAEEARKAHFTASETDLAAQQEAEALMKQAGRAQRMAASADKERAQAKGGARAVSLRSRWIVTLSEAPAALAHYRQANPEGLKAWLIEQAQRDVHSGVRSIPGFTITEEREAV